jgi:hypothetical protein
VRGLVRALVWKEITMSWEEVVADEKRQQDAALQRVPFVKEDYRRRCPLLPTSRLQQRLRWSHQIVESELPD